MPTRYEIEWGEAVVVVRSVAPEGGSPGRERGGPAPVARRHLARGTIDGKPFLAGLTKDPTLLAIWQFSCVGHLLTKNEEAAIRRAMAKADYREVDLRWEPDPDPLAERRVGEAMRNSAFVFLDVPDRGLNARVKALGAMWDAGAACWSAMAGVPMEPFEALGAVVRPRPEWRRLAEVGHREKEAVKALGGRWLTRAWYVDVATCGDDVLRSLRDDLGIRIMETPDELWAWMDLNGINAEPGPGAFPEWIPPEGPANPRM